MRAGIMLYKDKDGAGVSTHASMPGLERHRRR